MQEVSSKQSDLGGVTATPDYGRSLYFPLQGTVLAVYPVEDPLNKAEVWFCDVQLHDGYPMLHRVWVGRPGFHEETKRSGARMRRDRNPAEPWAENGTGGWHQSLLPGDQVVVQFIAGDIRRGFISHFWPSMGQGQSDEVHPHGGGFPFNHQERWRATGLSLVSEVVKRLDATKDLVPQWTWLFNGAFLEITNDGSLLLQSSVNRNPFIPADFPNHGLASSPTPLGNLVLSTRGARDGSLVLTTGKAKIGDSKGNVLVLAYDATEGNVIIDTAKSKEGHIIAVTSKEDGATVYAEDAEGDYIVLVGGLGELSGEEKAVLRAPQVYLGNRSAPEDMVTYADLRDCLENMWQIFDRHVHGGITTGESYTETPHESQYSEPWLTTYQSGEVFHSKNCHLTKDESVGGAKSAPKQADGKGAA